MGEIGAIAAAVAGAAALVGAITKLLGYFHKISSWIDNQGKQDEAIRKIKDEQCIIVYGTLACLKGLKEQGCNGPVTEAINELENYLNAEAHK